MTPSTNGEPPTKETSASDFVAPVGNVFVIAPHIKKHFGPDGFVFHEKKSTTVHLDVHVVNPSPSRPFYTLLTSGMSDLPMAVPEGLESLARIELCLCLPPEWPLKLDEQSWKEPQFFWPISALKRAAKYPHENKTWLSWGHTVPYTKAMDPDGRFTGLLFVGPGTFPDGASELMSGDGEPITYLAVIPLLQSELDFVHAQGGDALDEKLIEAGVSELLDPHRKSVV